MKPEYLSTTVSTCKQCGRLLPAKIYRDTASVWFEKICPEHGPQKALLSTDPGFYTNTRDFFTAGSVPLSFSTSMAKGCPDSCGFCPEHEQHVCMPIIEITDHCDLTCPICLVKNQSSFHHTRADVAKILDRLIASEGQIDVVNLSGGEPTVNPHFREIVEECLSRREILRVSVSTNGLRLAEDADLLHFLCDRNVVISLQFDGKREDVYQTLRGKPILAKKLALIDAVTARNAAMSLTMTVTRGVNEDQVKEVVDLLFARENIISAMFQPAVYTARNHQTPRPADAVTIPDIIRLLDGSANGMVEGRHFSPLPCSHPGCFALAFYLKAAPQLYISFKGMIQPERYVSMIENRAVFGTDPDSFRQAQEAVYDLWSGPSALTPDCQKALKAAKNLIASVSQCGCFTPGKAVSVAERQIKSIFIHQFMDRDTFDLSRVRKCCTVYPLPDGRFMPGCVYNCRHR